MEVRLDIEQWPLKRPVHITGHTFVAMDVVVVTLAVDGLQGRGEAAGVYYRGETAQMIAAQIRDLDLRGGLTRAELALRLPPGGARNALDCALWDLEAKQTGAPVWMKAGFSVPRPLVTTFTLGADDPGRMAELAVGYRGAMALKLKLLGDGGDGARVAAVRAARPDVWLGVDANQGFTRDQFDNLLPALVDARVQLVEQPFPCDRDSDLDGLGSPIPIAGDESIQDLRDLERVRGRFDVVNLKLDKCGGLTEGLAMAAEVRSLGLKPMVGCMGGTSLAMAAGCVLGQVCDLVDLDAPIFLARDRQPAVTYRDGLVYAPPGLWGDWGVRPRRHP